MKKVLLLSTLLLISTAIGADALAQRMGGWNTYKSETGLFSVEMPGKPEIAIDSFRPSPEFKVHSEEIVSTIDQRAYKNSLKTYSVRLSQTWGPGLSGKNRRTRLQQDLEYYIKQFEAGEVDVKNIEIPDGKEYLEYLIHFEDPKMGLQGIKTRIHYTDTARIEQTVSGPHKIMKSSKTERFLDSIYTKRGYTKAEDRFDSEWERYLAENGAFTTLFPKEKNAYYPYDLQKTVTDRAEVVKSIFYDPLRQQNMFYTVYSYTLNKPVTDVMVKQVMAKQHIRRYHPTAQNISFTSMTRDGYPILKNETVIPSPPKKTPYINTIRIRAQYHGNVLIIQEIIGHHPLTRSNFSGYLMNMLKFTPERAIALQLGQPDPSIPSPPSPDTAVVPYGDKEGEEE